MYTKIATTSTRVKLPLKLRIDVNIFLSSLKTMLLLLTRLLITKIHKTVYICLVVEIPQKILFQYHRLFSKKTNDLIVSLPREVGSIHKKFHVESSDNE